MRLETCSERKKSRYNRHDCRPNEMPALKGTTGPRGVDYLYDPTIAPVFDRALGTVRDENIIPIMSKT